MVFSSLISPIDWNIFNIIENLKIWISISTCSWMKIEIWILLISFCESVPFMFLFDFTITLSVFRTSNFKIFFYNTFSPFFLIHCHCAGLSHFYNSPRSQLSSNIQCRKEIKVYNIPWPKLDVSQWNIHDCEVGNLQHPYPILPLDWMSPQLSESPSWNRTFSLAYSNPLLRSPRRTWIEFKNKEINFCVTTATSLWTVSYRTKFTV